MNGFGYYAVYFYVTEKVSGTVVVIVKIQNQIKNDHALLIASSNVPNSMGRSRQRFCNYL
jgi:hypothetical protein